MRHRRLRFWGRAGAVAATVVISMIGVAAPSFATSPPAGSVSATPVTNIPHLLPTSSPVEQIRQVVQCGNTMYAVGTFTTIKKGSTTYTRNNAFSFSATSPYTVTSWNPNVNGIVNSIAFNGTNCADAYIGGSFTSVNGTTVKNLAEVDTTAGAVVTAFGHSANGQVSTLLEANGHILVGGYYTSINNSTANPYMTSLSPVTGKDDGFLSLKISGHNTFPGVSNNPTHVYNQALSHGGTLDLVMGDFTTAGGLPRQQIFMLNLATTPATVTGWTSPEWDGSLGELSSSNPGGYPYQCFTGESFYIQAAAWSPDDSTIYIGTTGYHPNGFPTGGTTRTGLCDAAASFPATVNPPAQANGQPGYVLHNWVNYTGCDSLYSAAADAGTAYFGGHERWSTNPDDCDAPGPTAISAPGMEGLSPATGALTFNPTRARGLGADDMLLTSAGLWIASDNLDGSQTCGGVSGLAGLCLLPYPAH
jgi:hypothetical protein